MRDCIMFSKCYDPFQFSTVTDTKTVKLKVPGGIVTVEELPLQASLQDAMQKAQKENKLA